ncbi:MAG TPA: MFS transporter [Ruminiclostridium sp.]|nr:MFS transporter [Ruminiclostridium sp.]
MRTKNPFNIYNGLPRGIYIIFVSRIIDNIGSVVLPMITLILTQKIGISKSNTGILATIFMLSQAPFILLGGKLVDKMGSKKIIVLFNTLGALAYIPCGFMKPNIGMALLIALAANLFSVSSPAYNSIVTELVDDKKIKSAYSILYLGYNLGLAIGPAIGGILFNKHLQALFFIDAATCIISTALVYFLVPNTDIRKKCSDTSFDLKDSAFKVIIKSPSFIIFSLILLAYNFCYSQWGFMLPLQSAGIFKSNGAKFYSLLVSINAISVIVLTPFLTHFTHKLRPLSVVAAGGLFYMLSFLMFAEGKVLLNFAFAAIILTVGQILININVNIFVAQQTPQAYIGRANSVLSIINGAGIAVGPVIMGHVLLIFNFTSSWILISVLMFIGTIGMLSLSFNKYSKIKEAK